MATPRRGGIAPPWQQMAANPERTDYGAPGVGIVVGTVWWVFK